MRLFEFCLPRLELTLEEKGEESNDVDQDALIGDIDLVELAQLSFVANRYDIFLDHWHRQWCVNCTLRFLCKHWLDVLSLWLLVIRVTVHKQAFELLKHLLRLFLKISKINTKSLF